MNPAGLFILALMIAAGGVLILLFNDRQARIVERRIVELAHGVAAGMPREASLSRITGAGRTRGRPAAAAIRLLGIKPDVKGMNIFPWQSVLVAALPVGYASYLVAAFLIGQSAALPVAAAAAYGFARGIYAWQAARYRRNLYHQLPDVIELLVSAVSAGLPVTSAFSQVAKQMPPPTSGEFTIVIADLTVGKPIGQALMRIFERTNVPEYAFLAITVGLQSEIGGGISESIENLAQIIRDRRTIAERAEARASEAKLSGNVLAVMPPIFAVLMSVIHPGYLDVFVTDLSARKLLVVAVLLLGFGIIVTRQIIRWSIKD